MKQKYRLVMLGFAVISILGVFADVIVVSSPTTMIYLDPSIMHALPNEHFTIDIKVADVVDLHTWQVGLYFDSSVLSFVNVTEGAFLRKGGRETLGLSYLDEAEEGYVLFTWSIKGEFLESGSGRLASAEFLVLERGESVLNITNLDTYLIKMNLPPVPPGGEMLEEIPSTAVSGLFFNLADPPVAEFTYSPSIPGINETITFDASASNATSPLEIIEYQWDFDDGTTKVYVKDVNLTDITTHSYAAGGTYDVSLTVIDDFNAAGTLVETVYNTTSMPQIWYDLCSTKTTVVEAKLGHNIAVTNVEVSDEEVAPGETVSIDVTVLNKGIETESFNVVAYYDDNLIETQSVTGLNPDAEETLIFEWDTTDVAGGTYKISAQAIDVVGEASPLDNEFIDGDVTLTSGEPFPTTLIIVGVVVVAIVAVVLFMYLRKKK